MTAFFPSAPAVDALEKTRRQRRLRALTGGLLRPGGLELTRRGIDLCAFAPGGRLLDLGCGPGATLELLNALGFEAFGLDCDADLLKEAGKGSLRGDFSRIPFADACLDGILCECALSLARDKAAVIAECRRALKRGAKLLLSDLVRQDGATGGAAPPDSCVSGALGLDGYLRLLEGSGFTVSHHEDHSRELRTLAARLVWEYGRAGLLALWGGACAPEEGGHAGAVLGYGLFIAVRKT